MKRKTVYAAVSWGLGLLTCAVLPAAYYFLIIPMAAALLLLMKLAFRFGFREILTVSVSFILAMGFYTGYENFEYEKIMSFSGRETEFSGEILEMKDHRSDKTTYTLKGNLGGRDGVKLTLYTDSYDCSVGDRITIKGIPEPLENNYLFNSADYNRSKGIYLTCSEISYLEITQNTGFSLRRTLDGFRGEVTGFISRNLPEDESGLICGMLFGDKSGISSDDKTMFYKTGIGHVMAVSGLHLVLFCSLFSFVTGSFSMGRIKRFLLSELLMLSFVLASGMSQSVLRAFFMMTLTYAAPIFYRKTDCASSVSIAFILLTLPCPFAITDPSLLLSVTGAVSAGCFAPYMTAKMKDGTFLRKLARSFAYSFWVSVGIFPVSVIIFGEGSLLSPVANMLLTPVCMAVLAISLVAALTVFLSPVFLIKIAGLGAGAVLSAVRFTGRLFFGGVNFTDSEKYIFAAGTVVTVILFIIFRNRLSLLLSSAGTALCVLAVTVFLAVSERNILKIAVLGNNEAGVLVVQQGSSACVIDITGNEKNDSYVRKYLSDNSIYGIDYILLLGDSYQSMSAYNSGLSLISTEKVFLDNDIVLGAAKNVCGRVPQKTDCDNFNSTLKGADISISGTQIHISCGEFDFICDSENHGTEAEVYCEYGGVFTPPECCKVIVPGLEATGEQPDVYSYSNLLISADSDGKFSIGGL